MGKGDNAIGFTLADEAAGDELVFPGLPGVFRRGEVVHPGTMDMTLAEMREFVRENDLPLVEGKAAAPKGEPFARTGGIASTAESDSEPAGSKPRSPSDRPGLSADEAEEVRAYDESRRAERASLSTEPGPDPIAPAPVTIETSSPAGVDPPEPAEDEEG